ncbi:malate dehydrogenase [Candidatus Daviesbacteria bacterium RIFCSPHIGHO2_01_FULL_44_29]|uniref:Malate dehydrogenase n=1 Tax=Candidatus Daviesbacteria bacterium RIFCSPHIGHO2_02_FULL_43_12 TaxID=1797776 RepID=A0A1F5KK11_9BACT|nr:MAG: malate dehydrogenase [Candidatus Daviesbacteria bacterium RIFCSPHIGHO2_01_FULL_44_29]OGE39158.1 MAG: malate dehydrogenase [Candidatus Daviesbacteria bacterium RIFCSPHIGHO2_12_FULL_47_45]OGE40961.1 MAG: malate dehydrogenase [Candidatus Daviesbacteria bacterium RIFCSPHIGHO2_02_FULL_43_12]OGE69888.1 MAG: malate dehydrogenase [Candidatus Daviesbacteria bacterium RIFCSPLOWO2_01_FULL_43_15]
MEDLKARALAYHAKFKGKITTLVQSPITNKEDLSLAYTPGVAEVSRAVAVDKSLAYQYTLKGHTVAVITDGSAVLGLGNIGPEAALPVMEGKAALFKTFADIDAFPLCLATQDTQEIIRTVRLLAPVFGGINLEDISAPRCFEIESSLQDLGIPVMHDDQHGTAVVVLAGLLNAVKVVGKEMKNLRVIISGAGAAGVAVTKLIIDQVKEVIVCDTKGVIYDGRIENMDSSKEALAKITNPNKVRGRLQDALRDADVFVGVSAPNLLTAADCQLMAANSIVFAMANPVPEIMPDEAKKGGVRVVATGRSDFPNQINNSLAFPGIFKGALSCGAKKITREMKLAAAWALADLVPEPTFDKIIPGPFDPGVVPAISAAVASSNKK